MQHIVENPSRTGLLSGSRTPKRTLDTSQRIVSLPEFCENEALLELLEEATRVLRHNACAKQDARYLNLWVRYASYVEKPELIYEFLLANEIGTDWGRLYEEYATVLEKGGR